MLIFNLIEYSDTYSKISGSLCHIFDAAGATKFAITEFFIFQFKFVNSR